MDGATDCVSLSSRIVSRDSVLAMEFSYRVGRPELIALDRRDDGAVGGGGAGWKKLRFLAAAGAVGAIGRLKFMTGRDGK